MRGSYVVMEYALRSPSGTGMEWKCLVSGLDKDTVRAVMETAGACKVAQKDSAKGHTEEATEVRRTLFARLEQAFRKG
jgi:hypothetical protein